MESIRQCIFSVVVVSLISSLILCLIPKGVYSDQLRFLCGCYLLLLLVGKHQLFNWQLPDLAVTDGSPETAWGEELSRNARRQHIIAKTQTYILSKGEALGADLTVTVFLSDELVPETVMLSGDIHQNARNTLSVILTQELGITKENQIWTG